MEVFTQIKSRNYLPILCGGSGMYLEAVLDSYQMFDVPEDIELREELSFLTDSELNLRLANLKNLHNTTDTDTRDRCIRGIEIEEYYKKHPAIQPIIPNIKSLIVGVKFDRDTQRNRISIRLKERLSMGMVEEVRRLMNEGVSPDVLIYYGLEYKFITLYIQGKLSYDEMIQKLETAIHQFGKRQMTWFRRMERKGLVIHWLDGYMPMDDKINTIEKLLRNE